jgi:sulfoxide reductase catalytic subunit YedY
VISPHAPSQPFQGIGSRNEIRRRGWKCPKPRRRASVYNHGRFSGARGGGDGLAPSIAWRNAYRRPDRASISTRPSRTRNSPRRPITDEKINGNYNNFYEFNSSKSITKQAQAEVRPWTIKIDGMVEKPWRSASTIWFASSASRSGSTVTAASGLEHGGAVVRFPDGEACQLAKPLSSATYVRMKPSSTSRSRRDEAVQFPWPVEASP